MKTYRVILSKSEVTQALLNFAYNKLGFSEEVTTGKIECLTMFGELPDVTPIITQARVEMELPDETT